jgi:UDP-glucose 4-epimerase
MNGKKVLVTGGAGFIGSELVRQAKQEGFLITIVDNLLNGKLENVEGVLDDQVRLVVGDIFNREQMKNLMQGIDIVYHLACLCVRHSLHCPMENHETNATGTLQMISLAHEAGAKRFVFTSSAEVYGDCLSLTDSGALSENHPTRPTNVYGAAKMAGEGYALSFYRSYGFPAVVLRLFNTFGPRCHQEGDCGEVIPKFMLRSLAGQPLVVFGDGKQTRDFNFVSDTARAILMAGIKEEAVGQIINIGSGYETSVNDLTRQIAEVSKRENVSIIYDKPRPGDIPRLYADGTKAAELLGYKPMISLHDGLIHLREWYSNQELSVEELLAQEVVHNWDQKELLRQTHSRADMEESWISPN